MGQQVSRRTAQSRRPVAASRQPRTDARVPPQRAAPAAADAAPANARPCLPRAALPRAPARSKAASCPPAAAAGKAARPTWGKARPSLAVCKDAETSAPSAAEFLAIPNTRTTMGVVTEMRCARVACVLVCECVWMETYKH